MSSRPVKSLTNGSSFYRDIQLGKGSFGIVFEGTFRGSKVAVKRVMLNKYKKFEDNFLTISHPNVVAYLAIEQDLDFVYIVMELCAGTLQDVVGGSYEGPSAGPMEFLLFQISLGLEFLHSKGIIHRDIKPPNILISAAVPGRRKRPLMKLADFGLCKQQISERTYFSKSAKMIGTEKWAAPECVDEHVETVRFSADVFSLGCVCGYALTRGHHPFGDNAQFNIREGIIDWQKEHLVENKEMRAMIRRMISKEPENRPSLSSVVELFRQTSLEEAESRRAMIDICLELSPDCQGELLDELQRFIDAQFSNKHRNGCNPLMLVCRGTNEDDSKTAAQRTRVIQILLSEAARPLVDINHRDELGENALHYLCQYYSGEGIVEIAKSMIRRGIKVNEANHYGWTPLYNLFFGNNLKARVFVELLLDYTDINGRSNIGETLLHVLAFRYKGADICDIMGLLIDKGANVNAVDIHKQNALFHLCRHNSNHPKIKEAIVFLVDKGIDVNHVDKDGWNVLMHICLYGARENTHDIVKFLIEKGIDVKKRSAAGDDSVLTLCRHYNGGDLVDILRTLLRNGLGVNSTRTAGPNTLRLLYTHYDHRSLQDVVNMLLERGIDVYAGGENWHDAT